METTKLNVPFRYVAKERCDCGQEEVAPAEWELVAQKMKENGEFLIRNEQGKMWRHLPFRLGGCIERERPVEGFASGSPSYPTMDARTTAFPDRPEQPPLKPIEPLSLQGEGGEQMKSAMKEMTVPELARLAGVKPASVRTRLPRKGIQILHRKTETGMHVAYVAGKDVPRAIQEARAIRPRGRKKEQVRKRNYGSPAHLAAGAYAREVLGLKRLHEKGILSEVEHQAALRTLKSKFYPETQKPQKVEFVSAVATDGDASKALSLIRRVLEQNHITMLHFENGKITARRSVTTSQELSE